MARLRPLVLAAAAAAALALAAPGPGYASADEVFSVKAPPAPGPAALDHVLVHRFGPPMAPRVLVLMPGTIGGAGDFTLDSRYLVNRVKGLQVWAIDRRSQALEDTSMFRAALRGQVSLKQMFDYYLGWAFNGGNPPDHFQLLDGNSMGFARKWGMAVALRDARAVVRRARGHGRRQVVLGGHSLGASLTAAYAAWDFHGRPGFKDLDGLVLIDGGLLGSFDAFDLNQARQAISELSTSNPFFDLLELGIPESAGLFAEVGAAYAKLAPAASATTLQSYPLLPAEFNPPFPVTDRGLLGYAFDRDTSPPDLSLIHVNGGGLAASGSPRDWVDGGLTPISRLTETFAQEPSNAVEWYFPTRLTIDTNGADQMRRNAVARFLGLRLFHTRQIDVPIYAIQTDLAGAHVLRGARRLIRRARTTRRQSVLVNQDPRMSHLDPLIAAPRTNAFLRTIVPFLRDKAF